MKGSDSERIPLAAIGQAVLIAAIWGFNFVVIKVGVSAMPPLMLAALRFVFSAFPAVLFVRRPKSGLGRVAAYGLALGLGEFGLLFSAIKLGAPAGLSSILLQSQAFFTALLAAIFIGEKVRARSVAGMLVAAAGLALFAVAGRGPGGIPAIPLAMILLAALSWAGANVIARTMPGENALSLMAWSSLFSPLPLAALSFLLEGPAAIGAAFSAIGPVTIGAIAYLVILSTLLGYGLWNSLIMRHGASRIAPFSLMVPVFGVGAAALALGERFGALDAAGAALILAGLVLHASAGRAGAGRAGARRDTR